MSIETPTAGSPEIRLLDEGGGGGTLAEGGRAESGGVGIRDSEFAGGVPPFGNPDVDI
jgi:hypothetical protein